VWNGRKWTSQTMDAPKSTDGAQFAAVSCATGDACLAIGVVFTRSNTRQVGEAWNGKAWRITRIPYHNRVGELSALSCSSRTSCWTVGDYSNRALTGFWNGHDWNMLPYPSPAHPGFLTAVSCPTRKACTAVGTVLSR